MGSKYKYRLKIGGTLPERFSGHLVETRAVHVDQDAAGNTSMQARVSGPI